MLRHSAARHVWLPPVSVGTYKIMVAGIWTVDALFVGLNKPVLSCSIA